MSGVSGDPSYRGHTLGRDNAPHGNGAGRYPELRRNPVLQAAGAAQEIHAEEGRRHKRTLSQTARLGQGQSQEADLNHEEAALLSHLYLLRTAELKPGDTKPMSVGKTILEARKARGISQRQFAKMLNVQPSAVNQWESDTTLPRIGKRAEIAQLLNIRFVDLLPEAEGMKGNAVRGHLTQTIYQQLEKAPERILAALTMQLAATLEHQEDLEQDNRPAPRAGLKRP